MARLELPFDLNEVIAMRHVSVVGSIEAEKLKACLAWIVDRLQHANASQEASIDAIKTENAHLNITVADLSRSQVGACASARAQSGRRATHD
jgi:GTP-dependent phosphoenolpyruvate carboxykinase